MNMQALMREAQKMQREIQNVQNELEKNIYDNTSSLVSVKMNGKKELISIKIDLEKDSLEKEDIELLQDMILVAVNNCVKKVEQDKEKKLGKYGQGLSGLL